MAENMYPILCNREPDALVIGSVALIDLSRTFASEAIIPDEFMKIAALN